MQTRMKALRSFRYATRMLQADDEFDASRQDARVLAAIGKASAVEAGKPAAPKAADADGDADADEAADDDAAADGEAPAKPRRGRRAKSAD